MKKVLLVLVAMFGLYLGANAQSDSCPIKGSDNGIVKAEISSEEEWRIGSSSNPKVGITTWTEGRLAPATGIVNCRITYIRKDDGEEYTQDYISLQFYHGKSTPQWIDLHFPASDITSIKVYGAECE